MFKNRLLIVIAIVTAMLVLGACGSPAETGGSPAASPSVEQSATPSTSAPQESSPAPVETTTPPVVSDTPEPSPSDSSPAAFTIDDLTLVIDGETFKVLDNASAILGKLGDDYEFSEDISCVFDGMDKRYTYEALEICTYPDGDNDIIDQFVLLNETCETTRGIRVGNSKADVEAAYGDGYFMDGEYMTYTVSGDQADIESPRSYFQLDESDVVVAISLHYPTVEQ